MNGLGNWLLRTRLKAEDWARTHRWSRWPALMRLIFSAAFHKQTYVDAVARFLVSTHPNPFERYWAASAIRAATKALPYLTRQNSSVSIARSIVAKSPISANERGILIVSFETELEKLVLGEHFERIEAQYQIIFLPTWQPAYSRALFLLAARATRSYCLMSASPDDLRMNIVLGELCVPLPFQASSWARDANYPISIEKTVDIVMLANFSKYKRHWKLFEGLRDIGVPLRVVIAGRPWGGRTAETLMTEARAFGVDKTIELVPDPTDEMVATLLARSRLFCALSHREGSFIAVAEALLAGTPVALYSNAVIGSKAFINLHTGFLLNPQQALAPQLRDILKVVGLMQPGTWARSEISAEANVAKLNKCMQQLAQCSGEAWTTDVTPFFCQHFAFRYAATLDDSLHRDDRESLSKNCGLHFEALA